MNFAIFYMIVLEIREKKFNLKSAHTSIPILIHMVYDKVPGMK